MSSPDHLKAELIERVAALAHDRLPGAEADHVERFVGHYYDRVAPEDVLPVDPINLCGAAVAHWSLARQRRPGTVRVRVYNPRFDQHGWQSTHTVVQTVTDDMPFLVDSVTIALSRHGLGIHLIVHPSVYVRRGPGGELLGVLDRAAAADAEDALAESFIHVEVDRHRDPDVLADLKRELEGVLGDVRAAVEDWPAMRQSVVRITADLDANPPPVEAEELAEARAFLPWLTDHHFTFLGYREYELATVDGEETLCTVPGSGLGILRETGDRHVSSSFAKLPFEVRRLAHERNLLNLTKANTLATVHRASYLDYVGVKRFDENGEPVGERRFLGLYTSVVYDTSPTQIPLLRRKVATVLDRAAFPSASHSGKELLSILETYPRDELLEIDGDELFRIAMGILHLQARPRVRLFVRRERFGRYFSCLVFLPRDRYSIDTRVVIQRILLDAFGGVSVEHTVRVSESVLARLHFIIRVEVGEVVEYDAGEIERRLADAVRSWPDDLRDLLVLQCGEDAGLALFHGYREAFPLAYRADNLTQMAVTDIRRIERLGPDDLDPHLHQPFGAPPGSLRLRLFRSGHPLLVSDVLPLLENMGVRVLEERPYEVRPDGRPPVWIYDFGLVLPGVDDVDAERIGGIFDEAFAQVWRGEAENDGFNRLALRGGLPWRDIAVLRAYSKYLRQAGSTFSQSYVEDTLSSHHRIARLLVDLFHARFDPSRQRGPADAEAAALPGRITAEIDEVGSLDEDRILRSLLGVILATTRTTYFQSGRGGGTEWRLAFKLDPAKMPDLPPPRPAHEVFVYSPRTEGVHLRGGRVARGGIRWSDRREDFRTEVLGLMKAQMVKNAVIVPVGAKGGFIVKRPPDDPAALADEAMACYRTFVSGLLDLTDNVVDGAVVAPPDVVRYDEDDPYLVIAADKGTATFSDLANELAAEHGFWLGDAFASGGSSGYDHKKLGITARGVWESVKNHFRRLGIDAETTDLTVVGIGDLSGDVFGNGMLLSHHLRLIGAFDHRHVFLDPDPDPDASYAERERLFHLPRSSWEDYDPRVLSPGGGVFARTAKSIPLSPEARRALGVAAESLTPNDVVRGLLKAPVDLLWNGGIGTFVKASTETNSEVADRANDAVRIDGCDLRCRVVGEGGNLGFTQRGRIEFARAGGLINADFVDNSAGANCSDHEVNIKVLLNAVAADGDLTVKQRDALLGEMGGEVAALVLQDSHRQTQALSTITALVRRRVTDIHARFMRALEQNGVLDRALEFLPSDEAYAERRAAGETLTGPELAILNAHAKLAIYEELLASDCPDDPYLRVELERYFPTALRKRFGARLQSHPLRREIVANAIANELVDRHDATFAYRLTDETGAPVSDVARAYTVARDVLGIRDFWGVVAALDNRVAVDTQVAMLYEGLYLIDRATRWLLHHRRPPIDIATEVARYSPGVAAIASALSDLLAADTRDRYDAVASRLAGEGVPAAAAAQVAGFRPLGSSFDIIEVAAAADEPVEAAAPAYFALGHRLHLFWLRERISNLPIANRWQMLASGALRDELEMSHRELTADLLRSTVPELGRDARVDVWLRADRAAVAHYDQLIAEIRASEELDLAVLTVAVRATLDLVHRSAA